MDLFKNPVTPKLKTLPFLFKRKQANSEMTNTNEFLQDRESTYHQTATPDLGNHCVLRVIVPNRCVMFLASVRLSLLACGDISHCHRRQRSVLAVEADLHGVDA